MPQARLRIQLASSFCETAPLPRCGALLIGLEATFAYLHHRAAAFIRYVDDRDHDDCIFMPLIVRPVCHDRHYREQRSEKLVPLITLLDANTVIYIFDDLWRGEAGYGS